MRETNDPYQPELEHLEQSFCLTNLSTVFLIGAAFALSAFFWMCIWAVL